MITSWMLLALFGACCAGLIVHGLRRRQGVLEFPFLAGAAMAGWLLPQAILVMRDSNSMPEAGLIKALLMCCLCTLALYAGWKVRPPSRWIREGRRTTNPGRFYWIGLALLAVGMWGYYRLTRLTGGVLEYYSVRGNYALEWRGLPVAYAFFMYYLIPGYVLVLIAGLQMRSRVRLLPVAVPLLVHLGAIVILGRRSMLVGLLLSTTVVVYFAKRWAPPRWLVVAGAVPVAMAMFLAPYYRTYSQLGADHSRIAEIDIKSQFSAGGAEFRTMVWLTEVADSQRLFQYGIGFYNSLIALFVPKLLVGAEFKEQLFILTANPRDASADARPILLSGGVPTGPFSAFEQFWYFGAVCYYALSRAMKSLWVRALHGDLWAQASYAACITFVVSATVNDLHTLWVPLLQFVLPAAIVTRRLGAPRGAGRDRRCRWNKVVAFSSAEALEGVRRRSLG